MNAILILQLAISLLIAAQSGTPAQKQSALNYANQAVQLAIQIQAPSTVATTTSPQPADSGTNLGNSVNQTSTSAELPNGPAVGETAADATGGNAPPPSGSVPEFTPVHPDALDTKFSYGREAIVDRDDETQEFEDAHALFTFHNPSGLTVYVTLDGETKRTITQNVEFFDLQQRDYPYVIRVEKGNQFATFEGNLSVE